MKASQDEVLAKLERLRECLRKPKSDIKECLAKLVLTYHPSDETAFDIEGEA